MRQVSRGREGYYVEFEIRPDNQGRERCIRPCSSFILKWQRNTLGRADLNSKLHPIGLLTQPSVQGGRIVASGLRHSWMDELICCYPRRS